MTAPPSRDFQPEVRAAVYISVGISWACST